MSLGTCALNVALRYQNQLELETKASSN